MGVDLASSWGVMVVLGYIGPGPGITITGALIGLIVTVFVALLAVLRWPLRLLWRKIRGQGDEDESDESADDEQAADEGADEQDDHQTAGPGDA